jgi:hypothetical protein
MRPLPVATALVFFALTGAARAQTDDGSNGAVRFIRDVAVDYKDFLSLENAGILTLGGAASGAVHQVDHSIATWVQENNPDSLVGGNEYGSQYLHIPVAMAWWALGAAFHSDRNADAGRDLLRAQLSVVSWTYAIKYVADRTRPNGDPRSFPSGHASTSFATAMVLEEHYGWKLGLPAFLAAAYTGASRVVANQHWTSDVVFGAAVGMASGRTVTLHLRRTRVTVAPVPVPGGVAVLASTRR